MTKADAGSYTCVATNHFGTASSTGSLIVKGRDSPETAGIPQRCAQTPAAGLPQRGGHDAMGGS